LAILKRGAPKKRVKALSKKLEGIYYYYYYYYYYY
jgi:hypothetical protein